jgi:hypothetical protein
LFSIKKMRTDFSIKESHPSSSEDAGQTWIAESSLRGEISGTPTTGTLEKPDQAGPNSVANPRPWPSLMPKEPFQNKLVNSPRPA